MPIQTVISKHLLGQTKNAAGLISDGVHVFLASKQKLGIAYCPYFFTIRCHREA
jgi:hypothetical protein